MEWLLYILAAIAVLILVGVLLNLPDIMRYMRIRKM